MNPGRITVGQWRAALDGALEHTQAELHPKPRPGGSQQSDAALDAEALLACCAVTTESSRQRVLPIPALPATEEVLRSCAARAAPCRNRLRSLISESTLNPEE